MSLAQNTFQGLFFEVDVNGLFFDLHLGDNQSFWDSEGQCRWSTLCIPPDVQGQEEKTRPRSSTSLSLPNPKQAGRWRVDTEQQWAWALHLASGIRAAAILSTSPFLVLTDHFIRVHFLSFLNISVIPLFLVFFLFFLVFFSGSSHYVLFCCISSFPVIFCTLQSWVNYSFSDTLVLLMTLQDILRYLNYKYSHQKGIVKLLVK